MKNLKNVINYGYLLELSKFRKTPRIYWELKKFSHCFTGKLEEDITNANTILSKTRNNNTAHGYCSMFKWAFQLFYGIKFNPNLLVNRPGEISKFTTRLQKAEIDEIRSKFVQYIKQPNLLCNKRKRGGLQNTAERLVISRTRIYHCFEALLCSGMRIGELCSIDFESKPHHRIVYSSINRSYLAEIIINTEKTCKKREIYIPLKTYNFLCINTRMYGGKLIKITRSNLTDGFVQFAKWAKFPFRFTAHVLRRTKATLMHEANVDVHSISMVLGNTVDVVMKHYIISSKTNFDACEMGCAIDSGKIIKVKNVFLNSHYRIIKNR